MSNTKITLWDGRAIPRLGFGCWAIGGPFWADAVPVGWGEVDDNESKAAIDTFTKGLAFEVAAQGIRVNSLRPGVTDTDIHAKGGAPDRAARLAHKIPMQRPGTAEEIARAILFLLSEDASYITGSTLDVSGGR